MKALIIVLIIVLISSMLVAVYGFKSQTSTVSEFSVQQSEGIEQPENVKAAIEKSCIMCHNRESKNVKSKMKLNFDKFKDGYKTRKKIARYMDISEALSKGEMPPKKFLKKYPEKALTDAEKKELIKWAEDSAKQLAGE